MQHTLSLPFDHWFASLTPVQKPPHEAIVNELLSRFGVKSAMDAVKFMQSPEGKLAQACLNQAIQREIDAQDFAVFLQNLELQKKQHLAYFILSLEHDEEKARQHMHHIEENEQQTRMLHHHLKPGVTQAHHAEATLSLEETLAHYEKAREALLKEMSLTTTEVDILDHEFLAIEESISLLHTKRQIQQEIHDELYTFKEGDVIDAAYLEARMNEAASAYQQEITTLQNMTPDDVNPSFIERWGLLDNYQQQVNIWYDFKNALAPEQAIVQKNGVLYVINKQTSFDELSLEAREKAAHAYLTLKPRLERTRLKTEEDDQVQQVILEERRKNLINKIDFERDKISFFQTRLSALDNSIISLTQLLNRSQSTESERAESTLQLRPTPRSSFSRIQKPPAPTPAPRPGLPKDILNPTATRLPRLDPTSQPQLMLKLEMCRLRCTQQTQPQVLSQQQISRMAAIERSKLVEELKTRPKELIPGAPVSPSLLSMLIAFNKTTLNIDRRINSTPEQRLEDAKNDPTATPRPNPFKKPWET